MPFHARTLLALFALPILLVSPASADLFDSLGCATTGEACVLWAAPLDGGLGLDDTATSLAVSADGATVYTLGTTVVDASTRTPNWDALLVAHDAFTGTVSWQQTLDGASTSADLDQGRALAVNPVDRTVYATVYAKGLTDGYEAQTLAYSASGALQWTAAYNGFGNPQTTDEPVDVAVTPDGSTVVTLVTSYGPKDGTGFTTSYDWVVVAYDAATGTQRWAARLDVSHDVDTPRDLAIAPDGSYVVATGRSQGGAGGVSFTTAAWDVATGTELWRAFYDRYSTRADDGYAVAVSPDGARVYAAGSAYDSVTRDDFALLALDAATGAQLYVSTYDGRTGSFSARARDIAVSPDGAAVYLTGDGYGSDGTRLSDYHTVAFNAATGAQVWATAWDAGAGVGSLGQGNDYATALATTPDGGAVVVTGRAYVAPADTIVATISLDATTGALLWEERLDHSGSGEGSAAGIAVAPDSTSVYVAGTLDGASTNTDFVAAGYVAERSVLPVALPSIPLP